MQVQYRWNAPAKKFQLIGVKAQLEGVDSVIQAPTGAGKTAIVAGPHLWKSNVITVMIVPLLQLEDEMVRFITALCMHKLRIQNLYR